MGKSVAPPQDTLIEEDEDGDFETKNEPSAQNPTLMELTDAAILHSTPMSCQESGGEVASTGKCNPGVRPPTHHLMSLLLQMKCLEY